jgi:polyisoprenyl-teichoic acid--peptidoglycan teichoic acid transferase
MPMSTTTTRKSSPKAPPAPRRPQPKKRKRRSPLGRILLWGTLGAVAAGTGFLLKTATDVGVSFGDIPWLVRNPRAAFPDKDRINILVVGKDYSYVWTNKNDANSGQPYTKESRADTIVMVSLDLTTQKATALSIPRDSLVRAPDGQPGKINATYRRGGEKLLKETVTELLGVAPDYVVTLKDKAVQNVVDAVGGITVETIDEMHRDDAAANLHIHLPRGEQRLTGEQAIGFVRYREPTVALWKEGKPVFKPGSNSPVLLPRSEIRYSKEDGDFRRMKRQQDLIRAVVAEAKKPQNLMRIGAIADTSLKQLETELTRQQVLALATLYRGAQTDKIQTRTLLGKDGRFGKSYAFLIDTEKKNYLVDWLLKGDESAAYRLTTVAVKNSTKVSGAARQVASMLRTEGGFEADSAGNTEAELPEASATRIVYSKAALEAHAKRVAQLLGGGQIVKEIAPDTTGILDKDEIRPDITVVLGKDLAESFAQRTARH